MTVGAATITTLLGLLSGVSLLGFLMMHKVLLKIQTELMLARLSKEAMERGMAIGSNPELTKTTQLFETSNLPDASGQQKPTL